MRRPLTLFVALSLLALAGCEPCPDRMVPLQSLIGEHNANAAAVPMLWARAKVQVTLESPDGGLPLVVGSVSSLAAPNGLLMLAKGDDPLGPHPFVLIVREMAGVELFRLGVSPEEGIYYFWYNVGDKAAAYVGKCDLAGAPGTRALAVNPNDLLSVLGVCELPSDFTHLPTVALTMDRTPGECAYVLNCLSHRPVSDQVLITRQMRFRWSTDQRRELTGVQFKDANGVDTMAAAMSGHRLIGPDEEGPARMPTRIRITWPESQTEIRMVLSEMTTEDKWDPAICRFRDHLPVTITEDRIESVDLDLSETESGR